MREAVITHSPHAFAPKLHYTEEEERELYRTRIDAGFKPYTVIDVLRKVYHRDFSDDLAGYVGKHSDQFSITSEEWGLARAWVNALNVKRVESVFYQPVTAFKVDIVCDARIKLQEEQRGNSLFKRSYTVTPTVRLRYSFDFRLCHLDCVFDRVVTDERESLYNQDDYNPRLDKYLLPILTEKDYQILAILIRERYFGNRQVGPINPMQWVGERGLNFFMGAFPENGALGEYFFNHGTADVVNSETGEIVSAKIKPGTIIINRDCAGSTGLYNSTVSHEMTHSEFGHWFFALQRTHGHDYCSYMCKRRNDESVPSSPVMTMEFQANIFPRYLMIPQQDGRRFAEERLAGYGGERNLTNLRRLIDDMAEHYGTTKTMARSRLVDFGFTEAKGILQVANGKLVPGYISDLGEHETYTISEKEGIREYIRNPGFRAIIDTGRYLYVPENGVYCLNNPKYVVFDQFGAPHLRKSALENMGACCLSFKVHFENALIRIVNGVLQKGKNAGGSSKRFNWPFVNQDGTPAVTEDGIAAKRAILAMRAEELKYREPFGVLLDRYMREKHMSKGQLAEATGLSDMTIQRMKNKDDMQFDIRSVIAVAIALHLPRNAGNDFIERSPASFTDTEDMFIYRYMYNTGMYNSVGAFNRKLVDMGTPPLTNLVDGFDEEGRKIG